MRDSFARCEVSIGVDRAAECDHSGGQLLHQLGREQRVRLEACTSNNRHKNRQR